MTTNTHPARDAGFLSRLHDGELSPAERAHFESHRAHCAECRRAAAEFESALSLYRSSRPSPASPDLAARILRKLQTSAPARRPRFGPSFGIDLRWAGAFAAAVVAAIVGSTIVGRHEAREDLARNAAPIPIIVRSRPEETASAASSAPTAGAGTAGPRTDESRPPRAAADTAKKPAPREADERMKQSKTDSRLAKDQGFVGGKRGAPAPEPQPPGYVEPERQQAASARREREGGKAKTENRTVFQPQSATAGSGAGSHAEAPREEHAPGAPAGPPPPAPADRPERDRRASPAAAPAAGFAQRSAVPRLRIESLDGTPSVPGIVGDAPDLPSSLRGRAWVVLVDAAGRVREARAQAAEKRNNGVLADELKNEEIPEQLLRIRFAAGDRERRLLVRVE